jgi:hypothetical protein
VQPPVADPTKADGKVTPIAEPAEEKQKDSKAQDEEEKSKRPDNSTSGKIRKGLSKFWKHLMEEEDNQ